ncbi:hypothetical protein R3P38DRAFT_2775575 [Favolaschia claudopus]|uniref:Uncharacterized protein n=1 Tax=Favolaschia claudopus TaxID=2862362 RepID=A0AAW0BUI2_9AGAR
MAYSLDDPAKRAIIHDRFMAGICPTLGPQRKTRARRHAKAETVWRGRRQNRPEQKRRRLKNDEWSSSSAKTKYVAVLDPRHAPNPLSSTLPVKTFSVALRDPLNHIFDQSPARNLRASALLLTLIDPVLGQG